MPLVRVVDWFVGAGADGFAEFRPGQIVDVDERRAVRWAARGRAIRVDEPLREIPVPEAVEEIPDPPKRKKASR